MTPEELKTEIFNKVETYYRLVHEPNQNATFVPGKSRINYAGRVFDASEMISLVESALDFWLTTGRFAQEFERKFAELLNVKYCALVNSGSSANLLAVMALTSPKLGNRRIRPGDEVITAASGFPTTVAPILQARAKPVFVDVELPDANVNTDTLEKALSKRTKAVILAHTLGFPFDLSTVRNFCERHGLWLIEDNCDALGARYRFGRQWHCTGTVGQLGTFSFYPAHHITMGEGGLVCTNELELKRIVESYRDWGRDCWCPSGFDNSCNKRFIQQFGTLPFGYDHKYVYSHLGYNLKVTDMQAAVGCAQLKKLHYFIEKRKQNHQRFYNGLAKFASVFHLPQKRLQSDPSPFGFLLVLKDHVGFKRNALTSYLEEREVQTRNLFSGNLLRHPCFNLLVEGEDYRVSGGLINTDKIMKDAFWLGVYPGMTEEMIDYTTRCIGDFLGRG